MAIKSYFTGYGRQTIGILRQCLFISAYSSQDSDSKLYLVFGIAADIRPKLSISDCHYINSRISMLKIYIVCPFLTHIHLTKIPTLKFLNFNISAVICYQAHFSYVSV